MIENERYGHALGFRALTPLYDPLLRWLFREQRFKRALIAQAQIRAGMRVLDLGCGTGTLAVMVKRAHPDAEVVGLDGDGKVLAIARAKAAKAGVAIVFEEGLADQLPYPDASFDLVLSSLVFHHLGPDTKRRAAREAARVLGRDGELHVADFGKPHNRLAAGIALVMRHLERAAENIEGKLPAIFREAGFASIEETANAMTPFGTLALYQARKSASAPR